MNEFIKKRKKFQQIYLEITNICNLSCPFCRIDFRKKEYMTFDKAKAYIDECAPYTDSFYLHIKGEPLLHPNLNLIFDYLESKNIKTKLTTNGYYLDLMGDEILKHQNIKHINISLQSYIYLPNDEKNAYLANLWAFLKKITFQYVYLRNWIGSKEIEDILKKWFNLNYLSDNQILKDHIIYSTQTEFTWPNDEKSLKNDGPCLGGKRQLGVMVNGDVVLCCLDDEAKTKIGNLNKDSLKNILNSELYQKSINEMPYFDLCKKCGFRIRFMKEDV